MRTARFSLAIALSLAACKDKAKTEGTPAAESAKPATASGEAAKPADPAAPAAAPAAAAAGGVKDMADYETKAVAFITAIEGVFVAGGTNCDKVARDLTKLFDDQKATIEAIQAFEKANPEAESTLEAKMQPRVEQFEKAIEPTIAACGEHQGITDAMAKLD